MERGGGLRVNMGKARVMESGIDLGVLGGSGRYPCGVCLTGVGGTNAIQCGGCGRWVHERCGGIGGRLLRGGGFACARCLGTAGTIGGGQSLGVGVGSEGLEIVPEFCYLGDMLSAGGGCGVAAGWLRSRAAGVRGAGSSGCFPFSPATGCPFWLGVGCARRVWWVWCCVRRGLGLWGRMR